MPWPFFQTISPESLSLSGAFSPPPKFMPPSQSSLLRLLSLKFCPSYFILPLPLIRPSISLVHSSLSFL